MWAALSTAWSQDPIHTLSEAGTLVGTTLIVIWMAQTIDWQSQLKIILCAGAISGILSVAFALGLPGRGIDYTTEVPGRVSFIPRTILGA